MVRSVSSYPVWLAIQLICSAPTWKTLTVFFALNYISHALTCKSSPGQKMHIPIMWSLLGFVGLVTQSLQASYGERLIYDTWHQLRLCAPSYGRRIRDLFLVNIFLDVSLKGSHRSIMRRL